MIAKREWTFRVLRLNTKDKRTTIIISKMIYNNTFWIGATFIILFYESLLKVLRMEDSDDKEDMRFLYEAMDRAKEVIRKSIGGI